MLLITVKHHRLRTYLDLGVGSLFLASLVTGLLLYFYQISLMAEEQEAQIRALSRNRAQMELIQALSREEVGLRGFLATGDTYFLDAYDHGILREGEAWRNTRDNLSAEDETAARLLLRKAEDRVVVWHRDVASPLIEAKRRGRLVNMSAALAKGQRSFEDIKAASEELVRFLDARDETKLTLIEAERGRAKIISISAMAVVALSIFGFTRWLLRRVADPLTRLADHAWTMDGFPEPEDDSVREVDILSQALCDLDKRVNEREQTLRTEHEDAIALQAMMERIQQMSREDEILADMSRTLERLVRPDRLFVLMKQEESGALHCRFPELAPSDPETQRILRDSEECRVMNESRAVQHRSSDPLACTCGFGVPSGGSYLCLPLVASGHVFGVVNLQSSKSGYWDERRRGIALTCTSVAAAAIQTLRALNLAKEQAIRDPLTGVFNRRFLDEILMKLANHAARQGRPLSVLMLDIDHFKRINDRFGHDMGDHVLVHFSTFVRGGIRNGDVLARYGGEEFIAILPDTEHVVAMALAERIRVGVAELAESANLPDGCLLSVSIGVATLPEHGSEPDDLVGAADKALYLAKGGGRNQVVSAGTLSPT